MKWIHYFLASLFLSGIFSFGAMSQDLIGEWKIDHLMLDSIRNEYTLTPVKTGNGMRYDYGNHFRLSEDGTFRSWYTAPCGNDCFTTSSGKYILDRNHIQFSIDTITKHGECRMEEIHSYPINLGSFFIHRDDEKIRLFKSNGDLEEDQLHVNYSDSIDQVFIEVGKFHYLFDGIRPDSLLERNAENIASVYGSALGEKNYRILHEKKHGYRSSVVLLELEERWVYLFCSSSLSDDKEVIYEVSYFDRAFLNEHLRAVAKIDRDLHRSKPMVKELKNADGLREVSEVYMKDNMEKKVVFQKELSKGMETTTFYLSENRLLFFARIELKSGREHSTMEFYLKPNGQFTAKEAVQSKKIGVSPTRIYRAKLQLNSILQNTQ